MTLHSSDWSILGKLAYKYLRPYLVKIVEDSSNEVDDKIIVYVDKILGK